MANLLAQKMFKNYQSPLLRPHTVNQYFFVFNTLCYLVTQPYFWPNLFANNGALLTSVAQPFRYMNAHCGPSGESLTNYVAFL